MKSNKINRHYIGITQDLVKRLAKHNGGEVKSTKAFRPWIIPYQKDYSEKSLARRQELFLKKTAKARKVLFESLDGAIV